MAANDSLRLWRLAQIDNRLADVRSRAAGLDVGQRLAAEVKALETKEAEVGGAYRDLVAESRDLELANGGIVDKIKRIETELYGGKVVSTREVENLNKEIAAQKRQRDKNDDRPARDHGAPAERRGGREEVGPAPSSSGRGCSQARQVEAKAERTGLEGEYRALAAERPERAEGAVARPRRALRGHQGQARRHRDGRGRTQRRHLHRVRHPSPERTLQGLRDDKVMACETCHRLLYYTEGAV